MPQLAALYDSAGDWDVCVVEGLERGVLNPIKNTADVLGRKLPTWAGARVLGGIKPSESVRLANELGGLLKTQHQAFFEQQAHVRSPEYSGTQA